MGHRQQSGTSHVPGVEQTDVWNHLHLQFPFSSGNSSAISHVDNIATHDLNAMPSSHSAVGFNEHALVSSPSIVPARVPSAGHLYGHHHHQSAFCCNNHSQSNHPQHALHSYVHRTQYGTEGGPADSHVESEIFQCRKRKPILPTAYGPAYTSGCFVGESSSNVSSSSHCFHQPASDSQIQSWNSVASNCRGKDPILHGEGSARNVRPRYTYAHQFNPALSGPLGSTPFCSTTGFSASNITREWDHSSVPRAPDGRVFSAESGCMNHMVNQPHIGNVNRSSSMGNEGRSHYIPVPTRSRNDLRPFLHPAQGAIAGNIYGQNPLQSYHFRADHPPAGVAESSSDNNGQGGPAPFPYAAPLQASRARSRERIARMRSSFTRPHSYSSMENGHNRWLPQDLFSRHESIFLGSGDLIDQHRHLRLDVDNMSYEELLDLGERIGNVNTGLSEDVISRCMTIVLYSLPDEAQGEQNGDNCVICLENFKDGEKLVILGCQHGYHVDCIKQWLQVKNACPICKSPALEK